MLSGMTQAFYERAIGGSTFNAFVQAQSNPWFVEGMYTRLGFGLLFAAGYVVLAVDLLTIGKRVTVMEGVREAVTVPAPGGGTGS